ncbi:starvation-inducible DNA-binding protein [Amphibacillus marinus]|uniref:Starvation-inducible DNA-binding protein n=1 Tax=Amphibacillus marinus TaxID=872970 RepID=A0A1H8IIY2_9BACI|nr:Dps family protein [Amphibacillus marinus]SEN68262.1 starvation-inducible DNA-binding protein [Amphibacillus marinus]
MTANLELQKHLNNLVATHGVLFTKLHQHHWFVKGPNFFVLHEKFEELYDEINEHFDEFAERLLTIGGEPFSTLQEFLDNSSVSEKAYTKEVKQADMVKSVLEDFRILVADLATGIKLAGEAEDDITEDMFIGYKTEIEKNMWMLEAYLG